MNSGDNARENREDKSKIEELKKSLYSRNAPQVRQGHRLHLHPKDYDVKTDWEHPRDTFEDDFVDSVAHVDLETALNEEESGEVQGHGKKKGMSFFTKLLLASLLFFLVCVGTGAYLVFRGSDIVSANNIDINLAGPVSVQGGAPVSFSVQVSNKNKVALQVVDMTVDYPQGTADPADSANVLKQVQQTLPDIAAGGISQQSIGAIFFGEVNSQKIIHVTINYRVAGSNATFTKEKDFTILISSSPLTISATSFTQVTSGQSFEIDISVVSNSQQTIQNLLLKAVYPFGFTYTSASPAPIDTGHTVWSIGDLPPGGTATIRIKGSLQGEDQEARVFNFSVGAAEQETNTGGIGNTLARQTIGTEYISGTDAVTIQKPFLSLDLSLNGDDTDNQYIGSLDTPITGQVTWFNNTTDTVIDGEVDLDLSGSAFDKASVSPGAGFYDSANNRIVWNKITTPELGSIAAGQSGTVTFNVTPRNLGTQSNPITDPQVNLALSAKANRISETNVPEEVDSSVNKNILISSNVALSGQLVRSTGPFQNIGPIPPKVEQQTTYTVIWTVYNTSNTLDGVQVGAVLPPYVTWLGNFNPSSANLTYNKVDGQVTWNIGNVSAYGGGSGGAGSQQVAFQIGVTPGADLVNQAPTIVANAVLVARDDFTGANLTSTVQAMTTRFSTDPTFTDGDEMVTK